MDQRTAEVAAPVIGQAPYEIDEAPAKHRRNVKGSAALLQRLRLFHYRHAPPDYKSRFVPAVPSDAFRAEFVRVKEERKAMTAPEAPSRHIGISMHAAWEILDTDKAITEGRDTAVKGTVRRIQGIVCRHYGVSFTDLISERRQAHIVRPRMVAMYLAKKYTTRSLPQIGRHFGGRDHTTVLHSVNKIPKLMETDSELAAIVGILCEKIEEVIHAPSTTGGFCGSGNRDACDAITNVAEMSA